MRDVALAVGVFVLSVIGLAWVIANLACAAQFWVSQYHWMKRIVKEKRDGNV